MASSASLQSTSKPADATITPEMRRAIELELDAICSDVQFRASQRNCAFLRYVITETLAGRADEIKERTLGKELFGRPISYDTGSDAVVRVRANEVRKRLICYYEGNESQAGWRVHLPVRTYVPVFVQEEIHKLPEPEDVVALDDLETLQEIPVPEVLIPPEAVETNLPLLRMMIPTFVALFLCAATFRWQVFSGTPYLDFWETLLSGHAGIALVLDADPADARAVTTNDLQIIKPLLQTAATFHSAAEIGSSAAGKEGQNDLLAVHITHRSPSNANDEAAYVTVVPGPEAQLWVGSRNGQALDLAINSLSNSDIFPTALETAIRRKTPTLLRFADREQVTTQTLASGGNLWR